MTLFQRLFNDGQFFFKKSWLDIGCIMVATLFQTNQPERNVVFASCARWVRPNILQLHLAIRVFRFINNEHNKLEYMIFLKNLYYFKCDINHNYHKLQNILFIGFEEYP